jgi:eukaryotic-like serine/threonine-protein kinase
MSSSSDRNLLFGLLALQNNFIDREALVDAFHRWTGDHTRPLDQVLIERGALTRNRHALLTGLVDEYINLHGDHLQNGLAALSTIGSVREDLSRIADSELEASLRHVSSAHHDDDPYRTVAQLSVCEAASAGSRFRILRSHARGGLGEVFLARDAELNRDVALKVIKEELADDPGYRARFELEAEVTGGLEHPGIVPVHSLGHTADGRPYYAMRFIQGKTLKEAIADFHESERQPKRDLSRSILELRELLSRFINVCNAVAYAHSRGVLHRDLKPGNIMLGKYGETLVVDWGLAKAVDKPDPASAFDRSELPLKPVTSCTLEPTLAGSAVGTPAYMSPEQVDSRVGAPGVRSDVYCLGATLYHLLTGRAPCQAEQVGEIYEKVLAGDFPPPRSIHPRIAPALEAICLKSLARKPEDRYATAQELKADLERWLAGEPVSCYQEPFLQRMWRSGRRNPWVARGVGIATIFFILIFIFSSIVFGVLGLVWAILGAMVGMIVGAVQGQARIGARQGAKFGFQIGTIVATAVFVLYGLLAMAQQVLHRWLH